jgi:tetratricopeptide (TPR) repeat protein
MRHFSSATSAINKFLSGQPQMARDLRVRALLKLAEIHADFEMDSHAAVRVLTDVIRLDERASEAYYLLAQELYSLGRFSEAKAAIERVIQLSSAPGQELSAERLARFYYYLGRIVEASGDPRAATSQYRRAAEYDPGYAPPALALALRARDSGDQSGAEAMLIDAAHAAMATGGEQAAVPLQRGLARILLMGGDRSAAIEAYRGILAVAPDSADDRLALAEIYAMEDLGKAVAEASEVVFRDSRHAAGYRLLASYYSRTTEVQRTARVLSVMDTFGYTDDSDKRLLARVNAERVSSPLRQPLSDDLRRRHLLTSHFASPFGEFLDATAEQLASLFPEPAVGQNLRPVAKSGDDALVAAVAELNRIYRLEPEVYVAEQVPRGAAVMNYPRLMIVLDRGLVDEGDAAKKFALGWAYEMLTGRYALFHGLGRRHRRELGYLMKSLFLPEHERPAPATEFLARVPRTAARVVERNVGIMRAADPEVWIEGMLAAARRAGLVICDDFRVAVRTTARLNGDTVMASEEAATALGVVICGNDLVQYYLSDQYHNLRELMARPPAA